jgi:hypothetical protein
VVLGLMSANLVDIRLVSLRFARDYFRQAHGYYNRALAEFLETSTGKREVQANTFEEGVNLDGCLGGRRERALRTLAC